MLRRLAALPLAEAQEYSENLYAATKDIAPSLIRYTQATEYDRLTRQNLQKQNRKLAQKHSDMQEKAGKASDVQLVFATPDADLKVTGHCFIVES